MMKFNTLIDPKKKAKILKRIHEGKAPFCAIKPEPEQITKAVKKVKPKPRPVKKTKKRRKPRNKFQDRWLDIEGWRRREIVGGVYVRKNRNAH